jgi:hypothetical protein
VNNSSCAWPRKSTDPSQQIPHTTPVCFDLFADVRGTGNKLALGALPRQRVGFCREQSEVVELWQAGSGRD